ncbi:MAG: DUF5683 domain-containing protein [Balneolales bacterium]
MMNSTDWLHCLIPFRELTVGILFLFFGYDSFAQHKHFHNESFASTSLIDHFAYQDIDDNSVRNDTVPNPKDVMLRSALIPGWGQITNRQVWKVPIVYGMLIGITYYSITLHNNYSDYRAAYYNTHTSDLKFGPTPEYMDPGNSPQTLREYRDFYRNRRDFSIIGIFLAYGLNIADAYVYAHFRDFDVSDDLSANFSVKPDHAPDNSPFISLSVRLSIK